MKSINISPSVLLEGTEMTLEDFKNPMGRTPWSVYNKVIFNLNKYVNNDSLRLLAKWGVLSAEYKFVTNIFSGFISTSFVYWAQYKFIGSFFFSNIEYSYKKKSNKHIQIEMKVDGEAPVKNFFVAYKHVFEYLPLLIGKKESKVEMQLLSENKCAYTIEVNERLSILDKIILIFKKPIGIKSSFELMAQLTESQQEIISLNDKLAKEKRDRELMLRTFAHDINNALLIISSYTEMNQKIEFPRDKQLIQFEKIQRASDVIQTNIKNARLLMNHKQDFEVEPFDINDALNIALECVEFAAQTKGIVFKVEKDPGVFSLGNKDICALSIICNFLTNAIKYSPINSTIDISLISGSSKNILTIRDYGQGMDEETRKQILNGHRVKSKDGTMKEKGTGQGLFIANSFIEKFNGELDITSNANGTLFSLSFPVFKQLTYRDFSQQPLNL
jgi:signal transduction histidine kinase